MASHKKCALHVVHSRSQHTHDILYTRRTTYNTERENERDFVRLGEFCSCIRKETNYTDLCSYCLLFVYFFLVFKTVSTPLPLDDGFALALVIFFFMRSFCTMIYSLTNTRYRCIFPNLINLQIALFLSLLMLFCCGHHVMDFFKKCLRNKHINITLRFSNLKLN